MDNMTSLQMDLGMDDQFLMTEAPGARHNATFLQTLFMMTFSSFLALELLMYYGGTCQVSIKRANLNRNLMLPPGRDFQINNFSSIYSKWLTIFIFQ